MKLKYYLRGVGTGMIVTTLILMIVFQIHKEDGNAVLEDYQSETVAQAEDAKEDMMAETETEEDTGLRTEENTESGVLPETKAEIETEASIEKATEIPKETEKVVSDKIESQGKEQVSSKPVVTDQKPTQKEQQQKVRIEVKRGEYSDVVCRKLQEKKVIDDAEKFNKFLMQKKYDDLILPGVYDIPLDSTYEEIAKLLMTKVE